VLHFVIELGSNEKTKNIFLLKIKNPLSGMEAGFLCFKDSSKLRRLRLYRPFRG
jgi:hypothetical protein